MMRTITAVRFSQELKVGRNKPVILACEDGIKSVEVVAKFAHRCERGTNALIAEAISSMLAADLGLPIPESFVVDIDPEFGDALLRRLPGRSPANVAVPAFGSRLLPAGYGQVLPGKPLPDRLQLEAKEILAFDVLIQNSDRIPSNPNCLTNGQRFAIIDHELGFLTQGVIGWRPAWEPNALDYMRAPHGHLFSEAVRGLPLALDRFIGAVEAISDDRLQAYLEAIPEIWCADDSQEIEMIELLRSMRLHIVNVVERLEEVLQ